MSYETSHRFDSVCVVESLAPPDALTGTWLYEEVLTPLADREGFLIRHYPAGTSEEFFNALDHIRCDMIGRGHGPILHIEAHGSDDHRGLVLASGETVEWDALCDVFTAVNMATQFNLLVIMALCSGWWFSSRLLPSNPSPVWGIVGPTGVVGERDLKQAMGSMYRELFRSYDARKAMNQANDHLPFADWIYRLETADFLYCRAFRRHLEVMTEGEIEKRLDWIVAEAFRSDPNLARSMVVREWARTQLMDHQGHYEQLKRRFLMLDRFPQNERRFPLGFEDCKNNSAP